MRQLPLLFLIFLGFVSCTTVQERIPLKLWYTEPAERFVEALPLGNGRLGAMVYGGPAAERLSLNEESLWAGRPESNDVNPEAYKHLVEIRDALFKADYINADRLSKLLQGKFSQSYAPMGEMKIHLEGLDIVTDYRRELNLREAVATTKFKSGATWYTREIFVSAPHQVICVSMRADGSERMNGSLELSSQLQSQVGRAGGSLILHGHAPVHADPNYFDSDRYKKVEGWKPIRYEDDEGNKGMRFMVRVSARSTDGRIDIEENSIQFTDCSELTFFLAAATSFNGFDKDPVKDGKDEAVITQNHLNKVNKTTYEEILEQHIHYFKSYFDRVDLTLVGDNHNAIPTDLRLRAYAAGAEDNQLEALYFHFGRYLLISCNHPDGIAANLQGIWNELLRPPWSCNYTLNINAEMNYWPVEICNLSELHQPFIKLVHAIAANGRYTAQNTFGARGWCAGHNSDLWGHSDLVGNLGEGHPVWSIWPMAGPWLCEHLWEHYLFTLDKQFLKETAYPLMKGAAEFCSDFLVQDPQSGYLVTAPSTSPENLFYNEDRNYCSVSIASTMDMMLIEDLFTHTIQAGEILGVDEDIRQKLQEKIPNLYPVKIGSKGQIQEWYRDFEEPDPNHRHFSHLWGLYPGNQISPIKTPELADACRRTLDLRGDESTGWSTGWKINSWARLLDGNRAHKILRNLLDVCEPYGENVQAGINKGGSYINLLCAHPPFQIDGNFGGTAGITEMLLQSQQGEIHILPALPDVWKEGKVNGLLVRGGAQVTILWKNGMMVRTSVDSKKSAKYLLRYGNRVKEIQCKSGRPVVLNGALDIQ